MDGWMDVCMYVCMYACMYVCMYIYIYICIYIYTYIRGQVREWEHGLQRGDAFDYAPNVFDHEPRPFQTPQVP